ncbi:hypothetical protein V2J09_006139 [Rumex salicifolius]
MNDNLMITKFAHIIFPTVGVPMGGSLLSDEDFSERIAPQTSWSDWLRQQSSGNEWENESGIEVDQPLKERGTEDDRAVKDNGAEAAQPVKS